MTLISRLALRFWLLFPPSLRLFTYRRLIDVGVRLYERNMSSRVFRLPFSMYAKYGPNVLESEAKVMRFVAEKTTIPVPLVLDCIPVPEGAFIVMTRLPGEPLMDKLYYMTAQERAQFVRDFGMCLKQLHGLTAPDSRVSAFGGGSFRDFRISIVDRHGPFKSQREFYEYLYSYVPPQHHPRLREVAREVHDVPRRLCLTHNDLAPHNILVNNNRFSGLVDWECAAWLPEWWEYTKSMYMRTNSQEWVEFWNLVHPEIYPKELEVEKEFWQVIAPW